MNNDIEELLQGLLGKEGDTRKPAEEEDKNPASPASVKRVEAIARRVEYDSGQKPEPAPPRKVRSNPKAPLCSRPGSSFFSNLSKTLFELWKP